MFEINIPRFEECYKSILESIIKIEDKTYLEDYYQNKNDLVSHIYNKRLFYL